MMRRMGATSLGISRSLSMMKNEARLSLLSDAMNDKLTELFNRDAARLEADV
jgi:hypothetical protein